MNVIESLALSFEALKDRRLRSSLTILMVVVGGGLLVSVDGSSRGFSRFVNSQFSLISANLLTLNPRKPNFEVNYRVVEFISKIEGVFEVVPYIQRGVSSLSLGREETIVVMGLDHSKLPLVYPTLSVEEGAFVSATDSSGILLGNGVAYSSMEGRVLAGVGQTVKLRFTTFTGQRPVARERTFIVRGILEPAGGSVIPVDSMAFISTSAADAFFERGGNFDGIYVLTMDPALNEEVQKRIQGSFGEDFTITSPQAIVNMIQNISSGMTLFSTIISAIALTVSSIGIITTIHTSVMERIREIGLLKALGYKNRLILTLFLNEATIIGIIGGTLGIFYGVVLAQFISVFFARAWSIGGLLSVSIAPTFDIGNFIFTWVLCVFLSMVSGLYPAWRASKMAPVAALRHA